MLRSEQADMIFNDQRRAFSDEYVNLILASVRCCVEISSHSPLSQKEHITVQELKNFPCILVASEPQREAEQEYYRTVVGFQGEFIFAENLEEARMMVIGRKGFLPAEETGGSAGTSAIARVPLVRSGEHIMRNYCAFWKKDNSGFYVEEFAGLLKSQFDQ